MCKVIIGVIPNAASHARVQGVARDFGFAFAPLDDPLGCPLPEGMLGCKATGWHDDCISRLGDEGKGAAGAPEMVQLQLEAGHWPPEQREIILREAAERVHELERWIAFIRRLVTEEGLEYVGLLLREEPADAAGPRVPAPAIARIAADAVDERLLETLSFDTLYLFVRRLESPGAGRGRRDV